LQFAKGKALGEVGVYWLSVHGANTYGIDKVSYDARVQWVLDNEAGILATAQDPFDSKAKEFWGNADKPYQFLAFCFEWAEYKKVGDSFESKLAVGLDGSCNGLQHFSAMLRDDIGGQATNLVPADAPQDLYQRVADVCITKLKTIGSTLSNQLIEFVSRKLTKKPVMTLPYGSTKQSCREHAEDYLNEVEQVYWAGRDIYDAANFASNQIWDSIGEVVVAAREAMKWLRKAASLLSRENEAIVWYAPTGFKVYQGSMKYDSVVVKTQLCGILSLRCAFPTNEIDSYRQANGVAPNFVHSMDAAHLCLTIIEASTSGVQNLAVVHDSYGTYASDTPALARALRVAFCSMYTNHDVLAEWKADQERRTGIVLPDLPSKGSLDISQVLDSKYFFG
jgi:DNA-directed RNA polymerase